ncbi:hypothetical protein QOZ80_6BG0493460 [Eleusine coracana subsp. coracana]|nr:hypothetical protein QOZ80_6BG0493460 [Eleusine coracana subsp. coracana]
MAPAGVFSPVLGVEGHVVLSAARWSSPAFSAASTPALPRGMGVAIYTSAALGGVATRSPGALRFAAPTTDSGMVMRPRGRGRLRPLAAKSSHEEVSGNPPPRLPTHFFCRTREVMKLLMQEVKRDAFTYILLFISLAVAGLSYRKAPYSEYATKAIGICEKAEKVYKFICHFLPIALAFWSFFK